MTKKWQTQMANTNEKMAKTIGQKNTWAKKTWAKNKNVGKKTRAKTKT